LGRVETRLASLSANKHGAFWPAPRNPVNGMTDNTICQTQGSPRANPGFFLSPQWGSPVSKATGSPCTTACQVTVRRQLRPRPYSSKVPIRGARNLTRRPRASGFQSVFLGGDGNSNDPNDRPPADGDLRISIARSALVFHLSLGDSPSGRREFPSTRKVLSGWTFFFRCNDFSQSWSLPVTLHRFSGRIYLRVAPSTSERGTLSRIHNRVRSSLGGGVESPAWKLL